MLNGKLKKEAIAKFERAKDQYAALLEVVSEKSEILFTLRSEKSKQIIARAEALFSIIANKPIEFDRTFEAYHIEHQEFDDLSEEIRKKSEEVGFKAGSSAGVGIAAGAGIAAFGPTAAMAIATTFGTASTGTAISALGGAAATNAALAWLGGGAVAAGGGGMAAGSAFLALAGPVGWVIGGSALVGSGLFARRRNAKIAKEADEARREVETFDPI